MGLLQLGDGILQMRRAQPAQGQPQIKMPGRGVRQQRHHMTQIMEEK